MVMPAGIDAAADLELQFAEVALPFRVSEAFGDLLRDRDRAGIGEAAIIEAGASDDVADQIKVGRREARRVERLPKIVEIGPMHMRQHDVLRMRDAQFVEAVAFGQIGEHIDLLRAGIARNATGGFQADRDDRVAGLLVRGGVLIDPHREIRVAAVERRDGVGAERWRGEHRGDAVEFGLGRIEAERLDAHKLFLDLAAILVRADFVEQNLDPRLVDIIATTVAIIDAQARLDIAEQVVGGDEIADLMANHRRAAHAAADEDLAAEHTVALQ